MSVCGTGEIPTDATCFTFTNCYSHFAGGDTEAERLSNMSEATCQVHGGAGIRTQEYLGHVASEYLLLTYPGFATWPQF